MGSTKMKLPTRKEERIRIQRHKEPDIGQRRENSQDDRNPHMAAEYVGSDIYQSNRTM